MSLKAKTRQTPEQAAALYSSGQCAFTAGRLRQYHHGDFPEIPQATSLPGAIVIAAQEIEIPAAIAAQTAVECAAAIRHGLAGGPHDIVTINDVMLPLARTGPGNTFQNVEQLAARLLEDAARLTGMIQPEYPDTPQGAAELTKALRQSARRILFTHGPTTVHDGFQGDDELQN